MMAQSRYNPAFYNLYADFRFGLGKKRALQTVLMLAYKFSLSRILSIR